MLLCSGFTMTAIQNNSINPPSSIEHEETTAEEEHFRIIRRKSVNLTGAEYGITDEPREFHRDAFCLCLVSNLSQRIVRTWHS